MTCADTLQSAQERFCTTAWSLPSRSDSARGVVALVCHDPETTRQFEPSPLVRLKLSEKMTVGGPASGGPASGGPASGGPASGGPASGGPASGGPASGVPPSEPPAAPPPLTVKSRNQMPARSVHIPAAPAAVMAEAEESFTITFATPFAEPTSFTGFEPVTDKPMVAHHPRSAIPLGACPSTVTVAPLWRLTCSVPFASSATS